MLLRSKRKLPEFDSDVDRNRDRRRLKLEPSSSKSTQNSNKEGVLKLLGDKNQSNVLTCELRMSLFVAAVKSPDRDNRLDSFPPCFLNSETKVRDYAGLTSAIDKIPAFANINESTQLSDLIWEFLHWVLINPVISLEPMLTDIDISSEIRELKQATGLQNIETPNNSDSYMFKITQTEPKPEFEEGKKKYGSLFAFHGSPIGNFHSILHRGLMCSFNVRSGYGYGTYMSQHIEMSKGYAFNALLSPGWDHSLIGNSFGCIVIVEFVNCRSYKKCKCKTRSVYVCDKDEYMQLSHLYIYRQ